MRSRIIWTTVFVFAGLHLAVSIGLVLFTVATTQTPEWGVAAAAYLTTFPLVNVYDRLFDRQAIPITVQLMVPILIGALIYGAIGAGVGWGIDRIRRFKGKDARDRA